MADKTISVKGIPEDVWQAFRAKAVASGKNVGEALADLMRQSLTRERYSPKEKP